MKAQHWTTTLWCRETPLLALRPRTRGGGWPTFDSFSVAVLANLHPKTALRHCATVPGIEGQEITTQPLARVLFPIKTGETTLSTGNCDPEMSLS